MTLPKLYALPLFATLLLAQGCSDILSVMTVDPIKDDPRNRTSGNWLDDEWIETKSLVNLDKASPELAQSHINVTSYNGVVLLTGQVDSAKSRQLATNTVSRFHNVRRVHNELAISGATSMIARSNDSWISTKLKSKMLANSTIESKHIKVVTENGVVFLMGRVTKDEGQRAANQARKTVGVQKVVILFEYL